MFRWDCRPSHPWLGSSTVSNVPRFPLTRRFRGERVVRWLAVLQAILLIGSLAIPVAVLAAEPADATPTPTADSSTPPSPDPTPEVTPQAPDATSDPTAEPTPDGTPQTSPPSVWTNLSD